MVILKPHPLPPSPKGEGEAYGSKGCGYAQRKRRHFPMWEVLPLEYREPWKLGERPGETRTFGGEDGEFPRTPEEFSGR